MSFSMNQPRMGIIIPAYVSPISAIFNTIISEKEKHPNCPIAVILNVSEGPGSQVIPEYTTLINRLNAAGIITLGYTPTDFGNQTVAWVKGAIDAWKNFYPNLKGIYFANMSNSDTKRTYYNELQVYAKQTKGFVTTVGGAAIKVPNNFIENQFCADMIVVYEGTGLPATSDYSGYNNLVNSGIGLTPYSIPALNTAWISQISVYAGWVYMTNDSAPNPWDTLPTYFADLVTHVDNIGSGTTGGERFDKFGIRKVYHTKSGGEEWYVLMDSPTTDTRLQNEPTLTRRNDGSWACRGSSPDYYVRLEAWSPAHSNAQERINAKWHNVEITGYGKILQEFTTGPYLFQWYSRGGHHSTTGDHCEGSALKCRIRRRRRSSSDSGLEVGFVKEVCHSAYTSNRGVVNNAIPWNSSGFYSRWLGVKHVIYNFKAQVLNEETDEVEEKEFTRQELYVDTNVEDGSGNLVIQNQWKRVSFYEDKGGWEADREAFNDDCDGCDKERDTVLTEPGGNTRSSSANFNRNLCAWRTDGVEWAWKFLTAREIDPTKYALDDVVAPPPTEPTHTFDPFGVRKIYPTKTDGAEWYLSSDPANDLRMTSNITLTRNVDGSWKLRMAAGTMGLINVYQPEGYNQALAAQAAKSHSTCALNGYMQSPSDWRNIEMTLYQKVNLEDEAVRTETIMFGRGGLHYEPQPSCEGSSMKGYINIDGETRFAKEQYHARYNTTATNSNVNQHLETKLVGFKYMLYNKRTGNSTIVRQELWIDLNANNNWVKIDDNADTGGWGTGGATCGGSSTDQLITFGGPVATFRFDGILDVDVSKMSVREINEEVVTGGGTPGQQPSSCGS